MVLARLVLVALVMLAGCGKSLFDNNPGGSGDDAGPGDGGGEVDSPPIPMACPAPCVGDGAGDFNGSNGGSNNRWRYLDDHRDRTWAAMGGTLPKTGADGNSISTCANNPTSPACLELAGALLFTTAGTAASANDPAIELTNPTAKVLQLSLLVHVPADGSSSAQTVRLYRNSREDVLFTGTAMPGTTLEQAVIVDALVGDRFLLAISGTSGVANIAVHFFISDTQQAFPKSCELASSFEPAMVMNTTQLPNQCAPGSPTNVLSSMNDEGVAGGDEPIVPTFAAGPYAELGMAADFVEGRYFDTSLIPNQTGDHTVQFWFKLDNLITSVVFPFSDIDLDDASPGGFSIALYQSGPILLRADTCNDGMAVTYVYGEANYAMPNAWHFIRASHAGSVVNVCVDGTKVFSYALPVGAATTSYQMRIGRNSTWNPQEALVDGQIDDVRVFKAALPCE